MAKKGKSGSSRREQRRAAQKRQRAITMGLIALGALIIVGVIIWPSIKPIDPTSFNPPPGRDHTSQNGNALGPVDAPVVVVEFADFQCSACQTFWEQIEPLVLGQYMQSGLVRYEYRTAGSFLGIESAQAAEAFYCAADQDMAWEYKDMVYANYSGGNVGGYSNRRLVAMAAYLGMDEAAFDDCLSSGKYADTVAADALAFQEAGLPGTPSFLVNGVPIQLSSYEDLFTAIDAALVASGN